MTTQAMIRALLLGGVVVANIVFVIGWIRAVRRHRLSGRPGPVDILIGAVTNFLDTLGIGSFAPTTAWFKFRGKPADELIPGTLNIGDCLPAFLATIFFITAVRVEPLLLLCTIASAAAGAWLGAGIVSRMPRRAIQLAMGIALLVAAFFFLMKNLAYLSQSGVTLGLVGWRFGTAVLVNFVLGALMCIGIGNYAPSMIVFSLLGLHPLAAFPIMMGSDGYILPVAGLRFLQSGRFSHVSALGLMLGGVVGSPVAFFVVKELPLTMLRWLVIAVVAYAAIAMLRAARAGRDAHAATGE